MNYVYKRKKLLTEKYENLIKTSNYYKKLSETF